MRSVPRGSDRVTVLAISILAIGRDPVATALGTDCITVVLQIRAPAELGGFWSSSSINIWPLRGFGNEHFMAALAKQPNSGHRRTSDNVDDEALASELRRRIRGEVRFDAGSRALYPTDASNYRQVPIGVVIPRDTDDVMITVEIARNFGAPILARGGGTSLAGQCCNVAVVLDTSKYMNRIIDLDLQKRTARVEPGVVLDSLRDAASEHGLTFAPDPSTHNHCTLGGMIGNNSCGVHSVMGGTTADNVEELEILTYDGLRMRVGKTSEPELEGNISEGG